MKKNLKDKKSLNIAMLGHKRIPSREGGIEIVVEELATRMVTLGHKVTCYNRSGHHVSGKDFDGGKRKAYKGVRLKSVLTLDKKGLAAMTASVYRRWKMPVQELLDSLETKLLAKTLRTIDLLEMNGPLLREPYSKPLENGIFELRTKQGSDITRVLYFFIVGKKAVLTNGFIKKS